MRNHRYISSFLFAFIGIYTLSDFDFIDLAKNDKSMLGCWLGELTDKEILYCFDLDGTFEGSASDSSLSGGDFGGRWRIINGKEIRINKKHCALEMNDKKNIFVLNDCSVAGAYKRIYPKMKKNTE